MVISLLIYNSIAFAAGYILDLIIGDPYGWPHIIRAVGLLIGALEKGLYKMKNKKAAGTLLAIIVLAVCTLAQIGISWAALLINPWVYVAVEAIIIWQLLATKSLKTESLKVYKALKSGDIEKSRYAVSMIVGRDTESLDEIGVTKAAVETVAENASDGVIAPMFYIMIGGAAFGLFYKAANTMDSMIGYKNDRYMDFGRWAALFDDVVNFIPSRLSALLMIASAAITGFDAKNAARIWKRDRRKHASPNSAQTESCMAGALNIQLAGDAYYFGKLHKKEFIGDPIRPVEIEDIRRSHKLMYAASILMLVLAFVLRFAVFAAIYWLV